MKVVSMGFPKTMFPYRSLSQRLNLEYDDAGALVNSAAAEAMTSLLIFINKTYRVDGAGICITGDLQPIA